MQTLTLLFTLTLAVVPSRSLNAAGPQWFWSIDTEKFEPAELHCASTSVRQRRLGDLSVCPEVLAYQSSRKALMGRTLLSAPTVSRACAVH